MMAYLIRRCLILRITLITGLLFTIIVFSSGCGNKEQNPKELTDVTIAGVAKLIGFLPHYIGVEKGIYAEEGLKVEIVTASTDVIVSGLYAGSIDYSAVAGTTLRGAIEGFPVRNIAYSNKYPDFYIFAKPEIKSIQQLKGKTVSSTTKISTDGLALFAALERGGLSKDDVNFTGIAGAPARFSAMQANVIDASVLGLPVNVMAENAGYTMLVNAGEILGVPFTGLGTTIKKINESPQEVKSVIRGMLRSMEFIKKNKAETVSFISREWNISEEDANRVYLELIPMLTDDGTVPEDAIKKDIEMYSKLNGKTQEIPIGQVVDFKLLYEVQKELGLK